MTLLANLPILQGFPWIDWTQYEDVVFQKLKYLLIVEAEIQREESPNVVISFINNKWIYNASQRIKSTLQWANNITCIVKITKIINYNHYMMTTTLSTDFKWIITDENNT